MIDRRWDRYFLDMALLSAHMSKDPSTGVGAVIVGPDREVISTGFNGLPRGISDLPWRLLDRETKYKLIVHGEMNAALAAARNGIKLYGSTIYITACSQNEIWGGPPCTRCTVELIQAGIKSVVSRPYALAPERWQADLTQSLALLAEAGISYREVE